MATAKKTKPKTPPRKFLSHTDRHHFVWYFEVVLDNAAPASLPKLLWKKGKPTGADAVHVKKPVPNGADAKAEAEAKMVGLVDAIGSARKVRAVLDRLLQDNPGPGPYATFTLGQEYLMRLHEAYVFPTHVMTERGKPATIYLDGEREVFKLAGGGKMQMRSHRLVDAPPDAIPGLEALAGKRREGAEVELVEACRAFERAKRATGITFGKVEVRPREHLILKAEAARRLGVSKTEVARKIKNGELRTRRYAGREMIVLEVEPA